jgi:RNA polymerase sigma-70 factor (ECF subfamily)
MIASTSFATGTDILELGADGPDRPLAPKSRPPDEAQVPEELTVRMTESASAVTVARFTEHRGLLYAVAYRVLGSVVEAQDVVQDAWLRWSRVDADAIDDAEGYLVRVATRLAIDRLRSAVVRREAYVGPWLPEPMLTTPDAAESVVRADAVSSAMLLVLEALSPVERAVYVLNEAFGYSYTEIAGILGRQVADVRQLAHRARKAVAARRRRYDSDPAVQRQVTERFLSACRNGDVEALMVVLAPDVTLISDGGGLTGAPRKPVYGPLYVARAFVVLSGRRPAGSELEIRDVNGAPGLVIYAFGEAVVAATFHLVDGAIHLIHVVSNPNKLTGLLSHLE